MPRRNGFSYMIVREVPGPPAHFVGSDDCSFHSEMEMLTELGTTAWELVLIRDTAAGRQYYFKRERT